MNKVPAPRHKTRTIHVGDVPIGSQHPVVVQSMSDLPTTAVRRVLNQIQRLQAAGCQIIRLAIPDQEAATALNKIIPRSPLPVLADIHFDHRLALAAIKAGVAGLRLNPGNIGSDEGVLAVAKAARTAGIPIRVGANSGSLPKELLAKHGLCATSMVEAALSQVHLLEKNGFEDIKISVKASDVPLTVESYRLLAQKTDYPLHLGVTEAGGAFTGAVRSATGMGILLAQGIGDTIRVSLTADPVLEVKAARELLKSLNLAKGMTIISCPTCGRTRINLKSLLAKVEKGLAPYQHLPLTIAVMGCVVNGPGEAREADFGLAGGVGEGLLFAHGQIVAKYPEDQLVPALIQAVAQSQPS